MQKATARRTCLVSLALFALGAASGLAQAQSAWPSRPVKIVVPFAPGGTTDILARAVAPELAKAFGQAFVIENRAGAGGNIGAEQVAKSAPDGYTLLMGTVGTHGINKSLFAKLAYDPQKDFAPITLVAGVPNVMVMNAERAKALAINTVPDFIAYARKHPGELNYGSAGSGTSHHLAGELFKLQTKTFITHIPYRGAGPALQDLIAGNVDMMFDGLGSSAAHIQGGRIKALMVSGGKRNPAFPDVPCSTELGLPEYTVSTWYGIWAPKATPAEAQARAIEEIRRACQTDEAKTTWANQGADFPNMAGAQFDGFIKGELAKWSKVVKASGAKLD